MFIKFIFSFCLILNLSVANILYDFANNPNPPPNRSLKQQFAVCGDIHRSHCLSLDLSIYNGALSKHQRSKAYYGNTFPFESAEQRDRERDKNYSYKICFEKGQHLRDISCWLWAGCLIKNSNFLSPIDCFVNGFGNVYIRRLINSSNK